MESTKNGSIPPNVINTLADVSQFPLIQALAGRRSRRFCMGAEIPEGPLAFKSSQKSFPLTELEQMLVLTSMAGSTGWHYAISYNETVRSQLPSYSAGPAGRTFPSAAGFHTSDLFFTDDNGTYYFSTRVLPVTDLAQHTLDAIWYYALDGRAIFDDMAKKPIPGVEKFRSVIPNPNSMVVPLSFIEMMSMAECAAEISMSCYAGALILQAIGLGGWAFDGMDWMVILGASGDPKIPGFGYRYDTSERWTLPNITGLPGVFEGYCPPHYRNMGEAVEALAKRKYGPGGVYNEGTPGAWKDSASIRKAAHYASQEFKDCVALQAQYIYDTYGKFPATTPSIFAFMYLQAHHLDLSFYDHYFKSGAYLPTHSDHMKKWH